VDRLLKKHGSTKPHEITRNYKAVVLTDAKEKLRWTMTKDDRDILEILKNELDFIEKGGYGRSVRTPWQPKSVLQDSLTCINYGDPSRVHPCNECPLIDYVTPEHQTETIPCHFIALNESGETIDALEVEDNEAKLERKLKEWLRNKIYEIEEKRNGHAIAGCP